jgi:small subunit ribosomal protein S4
MPRHTDPIWRESRALDFSFLENKKEFSRGKKRLVPPGQHAYKKKRNPSPYGLRNKEKKKLLLLYGLKEKQLKNLFLNLKKKKGDIRQNLLTSLESRLDNLVFRSGLVPTRKFARQWVNHGHFLVNDNEKNIPSHLIKPSSVSKSKTIIALEEEMHQNEMIKEEIKKNKTPPAFLEVDKEKLTINYLHYPSQKELFEASSELKKLNLSLVVEWYNKKT